jgi:hypothetical protein
MSAQYLFVGSFMEWVSMAEQPHTSLRSPMPSVSWSGVELAAIELWSSGNAFSASPEEQRWNSIRVRLKAKRTGRLVPSEQRVKVASFWARKDGLMAKCTDKGMVGCEYSRGKPGH